MNRETPRRKDVGFNFAMKTSTVIIIMKDKASMKKQAIESVREPRNPRMRTNMDGMRQAPSNLYSTKIVR